MLESENYPFKTLPDYLVHGMQLVFVGINPGLYSVERGHYFARPTNRFWRAFSRSRLSLNVRSNLGVDMLRPENDAALSRHGIGFTDVVKLPSRSISDLRPTDFEEWAPRLLARLQLFKPTVACFHGITGYRAFTRYALGIKNEEWHLGAQELRLGKTHLFVIPNPSPANAHFTPDDQTAWYDRLADFIDRLIERP
jgi:TDG/mug DNA glycosylase family protein